MNGIMFKTLRMKLMLGFLPLLAILVGLGLWAIVMFYRLGGNIDVILRENYRSVVAVERMKEALERMDSGLMFAFSGCAEQAREQFDKSKQEFDRQLGVEQHNITVAGEKEAVEELTAEYRGYLALATDYFDQRDSTTSSRADVYFSRLLPKFENLRRLEDRVLLLNQRNMEQMNEQALRNAASSTRLMIAALLVSVALVIASSRILTRLILEPIVAVTEGRGPFHRATSTRLCLPPRRTSSASSARRSTRWQGQFASTERRGRSGCCEPRRPPRRRSTRFQTR